MPGGFWLFTCHEPKKAVLLKKPLLMLRVSMYDGSSQKSAKTFCYMTLWGLHRTIPCWFAPWKMKRSCHFSINMKEKFNEDQFTRNETKKIDYFYFPKTFLDLLCNLRLFFFFLFPFSFHLTYFESEFGRTLEEFWKILESSLRDAFLLFSTVAHIRGSAQCCNIVSSAECPLHRELVDFSPAVSGWASPHAAFEATWIKDESEDTHFWVVISESHRTLLFPQPPPALAKTLHFMINYHH